MHCMNDFGEEQLNLNQMINNKTHNPFVIRKNGSVLFSLVLNKNDTGNYIQLPSDCTTPMMTVKSVDISVAVLVVTN